MPPHGLGADTARKCDSVNLGCDLGKKSFKSSPCDSSVKVKVGASVPGQGPVLGGAGRAVQFPLKNPALTVCVSYGYRANDHQCRNLKQPKLIPLQLRRPVVQNKS